MRLCREVLEGRWERIRSRSSSGSDSRGERCVVGEGEEDRVWV